MKVILCDVCGGELGNHYGYGVSIGGFGGKLELLVDIDFRKGGIPGISRWVDVDLCKTCKDKALRIAVRRLVKNLNGPIENNQHVFSGDPETMERVL